MKNYLTKILDWKTESIAQQYDELPLWSSPFGLLLLDNFPIGEYKNYLDIGFGTGFPLIEIAQRLGSNCKATGIDLWHSAIKRAQFKIKAIGLKNIDLIEADASAIPFPDNHFDLITSNLGINNFESPEKVIQECYRVIKEDSSLCLTSNLTGTFQEFYDIFENTLHELGLTKYIPQLEKHIERRGTVDLKSELISKSGFRIENQIESVFQMRLLNGSSFLNHSFTIVGFIDPWRDMFDEDEKYSFFEQFENNLNEYSKQRGELKLSVPMVYFECKK